MAMSQEKDLICPFRTSKTSLCLDLLSSAIRDEAAHSFLFSVHLLSLLLSPFIQAQRRPRETSQHPQDLQPALSKQCGVASHTARCPTSDPASAIQLRKMGTLLRMGLGVQRAVSDTRGIGRRLDASDTVDELGLRGGPELGD